MWLTAFDRWCFRMHAMWDVLPCTILTSSAKIHIWGHWCFCTCHCHLNNMFAYHPGFGKWNSTHGNCYFEGFAFIHVMWTLTIMRLLLKQQFKTGRDVANSNGPPIKRQRFVQESKEEEQVGSQKKGGGGVRVWWFWWIAIYLIAAFYSKHNRIPRKYLEDGWDSEFMQTAAHLYTFI